MPSEKGSLNQAHMLAAQVGLYKFTTKLRRTLEHYSLSNGGVGTNRV